MGWIEAGRRGDLDDRKHTSAQAGRVDKSGEKRGCRQSGLSEEVSAGLRGTAWKEKGEPVVTCMISQCQI